MKLYQYFSCLLLTVYGFSQTPFLGTTTSSRVGFLNSILNPAELSNLSNNIEVHLFGLSTSFGNNKVSATDFLESNLEQKLINEPGDFSAQVNLIAQLPGVAFKFKKWGVALSAKTEANLVLSEINRDFAKAIIDNNLLLAATAVNSNSNQRITGVVWGEVAAAAATSIVNTEEHLVSIGATAKVLFPGTYANMGVQTLQGSITSFAGNNYLTNANAQVNFAYSGSLSNEFNDLNNITSSFFGAPNGLGLDFGFTYTYKKKTVDFFKVGVAIRNIGTMVIENENTSNRNWVFASGNPGLNLNNFSNVKSLSEAEQLLIDSGTLTVQNKSNKLTVNLPTTFNTYFSIYLAGIIDIDFLMQQRINSNNDNYQINTPNYYALIPRLNFGIGSVFVPASFNDYSNFNAGVGLNLGGFYIGSNSLLTNLMASSKDADLYLGVQFGF